MATGALIQTKAALDPLGRQYLRRRGPVARPGPNAWPTAAVIGGKEQEQEKGRLAGHSELVVRLLFRFYLQRMRSKVPDIVCVLVCDGGSQINGRTGSQTGAKAEWESLKFNMELLSSFVLALLCFVFEKPNTARLAPTQLGSCCVRPQVSDFACLQAR